MLRKHKYKQLLKGYLRLETSAGEGLYCGLHREDIQVMMMYLLLVINSVDKPTHSFLLPTDTALQSL